MREPWLHARVAVASDAVLAAPARLFDQRHNRRGGTRVPTARSARARALQAPRRRAKCRTPQAARLSRTREKWLVRPAGIPSAAERLGFAAPFVRDQAHAPA